MLNIRQLKLLSIVFLSLFIQSSCAVQKEKPPISLKPEVVKPEPVIVKEKKKIEPVQAIRCKENTTKNFNMSGIPTSPFIKVSFFDMDGDGLEDMISGDKYGGLHLYENTGDLHNGQWRLLTGYFDGIKMSAFSAPAVGDLNGDGMPEIVVGTGGFSSESGRILLFKNAASHKAPSWEAVENIHIKIGNDAAVTVVDYNFDKKPDLIAGNSEGRLFFFKNISVGKEISFKRDASISIKKSFGMYAVPAAVKIQDRVILIVGNSMGKLYMYEIRKNGNPTAKKMSIHVSAKGFVTPSFANLLKKDQFDLVVADGDGVLTYFENMNHDYTVWEKSEDLFNGKIVAGPASTPTISYMKDRALMVIGNIDGTLRLYEYRKGSNSLPWVERENYFKGIKVSGFSRGVLATWQGDEILVTGEGNGDVRAFVRAGQGTWREVKGFFNAVRVKQHSSPVLFDLDGDGIWEIITGAEDGKIYAYRAKQILNNVPVWARIAGIFDDIKVKGFSTPALARDMDKIYLISGQQNGVIRAFKAETDQSSNILFDNNVFFRETDFLKDVTMKNHSSPFIINNNGVMEVVSGDYDGNLRHFVCR